MRPTRTTLIAALASFGLGIVVVRGAPAAWRIDPWQGVLLGTALYMGAVHPWLVRRRQAAPGDAGDRSDGWSQARGLGWRLGLFLAIVAGEAYAYYQWLPVSDFRGPFVMLSGWVVTESMSIGTTRSPTAPSPRA